jgi:hypothetical protein
MSNNIETNQGTAGENHPNVEAFRQGQRDREQGWPMIDWGFAGWGVYAYNQGYEHPRQCPHGGTIGACSWCDLRDDGGLPESQSDRG